MKRYSSIHKNTFSGNGYTVIEILVVMAIIGVLGIIISRFQRDVFSFLEDINFRAIISFKKLDENKYEIVSIDYGNDDPNCCPSSKQKYIVSQVKGSWKVLEKTFIEKIKY